MENQESLNIKIWEIKNKIADITEYISSDLCANCTRMYRIREVLEQELKNLENERNRQS
jgi:hypothetical protein